MSFGRKGLDGQPPSDSTSGFGQRRAGLAGDAMPPGMQSAINRGVTNDPAMSSQLQSFLAAERANRPSPVEPAISEVAERHMPVRHGGSPREMWVAYLLWWLLGGFAAHRFYLGQATSAVVMLCAVMGSFAMMFILPPLGLVCFLLWFLWLLADAALIPGMTRRYNDALAGPATVFS